MMLNLVESFLSLQGEGKFVGRVAYFFRFAGCNLNCVGFGCKIKSPKTGEILTGCDTIRAVKTSHFEYEKILSQADLLSKISDLKTKPIIVITGGEPLLHYKDEIFYGFVKTLLERGYDVHFETNGTIFVDFENFNAYKNCVFAISPKLKNSSENRAKRLKFDALRNLKNNSKDSFYKFVLDPKNLDLQKDEIDEILSQCDNEIFIMPRGENAKILDANSKTVAEFCIKNGYNYTDRLHIRIWDDLEGK